MVKPPCGIIGDVDGDGDITQVDVDLASELVLVGNLTPDQLKRIDVNGDGIADIRDLVILKRYVLGEITTFPACKQNDLIVVMVLIVIVFFLMKGK